MKIPALLISVLLCAATRVCDRMDSSLNKGLKEEKSYTRHAMEYHRMHPELRPADRVLETWSTADYIAESVKGQNLSGDWAQFSNHLPFLRSTIQNDPSGQPFCVVRKNSQILVIDYLSARPATCTLKATDHTDIARIESGDMEFSGRTDYWLYVLKLADR